MSRAMSGEERIGRMLAGLVPWPSSVLDPVSPFCHFSLQAEPALFSEALCCFPLGLYHLIRTFPFYSEDLTPGTGVSLKWVVSKDRM